MIDWIDRTGEIHYTGRISMEVVMLAMANKIQDILDQRGWTIYKLHKAAKITYNTTHALVKADQIPDGTEYGTLKKIAKALGVKIDDLENGETEQ